MLARSGRKANSVGVMFCANAASFLSLDRVVNISENPTNSFPVMGIPNAAFGIIFLRIFHRRGCA